MDSLQNIIFDFDGTLADTSRLIVATMQKSIQDYELPYRNEDQIKATIGVRLEEIPSILWDKIRIPGEGFANIYRKNFELLKDKIPVTLFPGVRETLSDLKDNGYLMAIATSRSRRSLEELTDQLAIKDFFVYMLGGDNVSEGKPAPESIFKIMDAFTWRADHTLMVGDMPVDMIMGKNAGMKTCGVTYGNGKESDLKNAGANYIITNFPALKNILSQSY